jgi:hypothetical protein
MKRWSREALTAEDVLVQAAYLGGRLDAEFLVEDGAHPAVGEVTETSPDRQ